jgi:hypothetical protein
MKEIVEHQHMLKPYLVYSMPWSIQSKIYGFFHFLYKRKKVNWERDCVAAQELHFYSEV